MYVANEGGGSKTSPACMCTHIQMKHAHDWWIFFAGNFKTQCAKCNTEQKCSLCTSLSEVKLWNLSHKNEFFGKNPIFYLEKFVRFLTSSTNKYNESCHSDCVSFSLILKAVFTFLGWVLLAHRNTLPSARAHQRLLDKAVTFVTLLPFPQGRGVQFVLQCLCGAGDELCK